jgi:hypothetical protein
MICDNGSGDKEHMILHMRGSLSKFSVLKDGFVIYTRSPAPDIASPVSLTIIVSVFGLLPDKKH